MSSLFSFPKEYVEKQKRRCYTKNSMKIRKETRKSVMTKTTGSIAASTNIVKESVVMGDVSIGEDSTILFYAVLRGDDNKIIIGKGTNIQDNCTVHTSKVDPTMVGDYVTVGHNAILHGCTIGDNTLIGMGATVMNGSVIGKNCLIAAGSLVLEHQNIPDGSMVMGRPAKVTRALTEEEIAGLKESALSYIEEGKKLREEGYCL